LVSNLIVPRTTRQTCVIGPTSGQQVNEATNSLPREGAPGLDQDQSSFAGGLPDDAAPGVPDNVAADAPRLHRRQKFRLPADPLPLAIVVLAAFAYSAYLAKLTINHHNGFGTAGFDIGLYDQGLWLLSRFRAPFVTIMGRNLFGDHSSFILLPLVPFYWFGAGSSFLLFAQSVALGSTAIPVYLTVRRLLHSPWAACGLAVAFLLQPSLAWTNTENFHPDAFVAPLLGFALWAMVARRWRLFAVFAVLATMVKEDTLLVVIPLGLYAFWRFGRDENARPGESRNRAGLMIAAWSLFWTGTSLLMLRTLNTVGSLNAWRIPFGGPTGLIKTTFKAPSKVWDYLIKGIDYPGDTRDNYRMWYLWKLLTPVVFLIVRAPWECSLFILVAGLNIVSNFFYQYNIEYHYTVIILPGLFFAATMAIRSLKTIGGRRLAVLAVLGSCTWTGYLWGPTHLSAKPFPWATPNAPWVAEGRALLRQVPPGVPIAVFYGYVPHIGHRQEVYQFPVPWRDSYYGLPTDETAKIRGLRDRVEWVVTRDVPTSPDQTVRDAFNDMIADFELVDTQGGGQLFRRRGLAGSTGAGTKVGVTPTPVAPIVVPTAVAPPLPAAVSGPVDVVPAGASARTPTLP
jgi:uncharacterized membrane protein